jgi:hypothetical protein
MGVLGVCLASFHLPQLCLHLPSLGLSLLLQSVPSIMLAPYPAGVPAWDNAQLEGDYEYLMTVVNKVRAGGLVQDVMVPKHICCWKTQTVEHKQLLPSCGQHQQG